MAPYIKFLPVLLLSSSDDISPDTYLTAQQVGFLLAFLSLINFVSSTLIFGPLMDKLAAKKKSYRVPFLLSFIPPTITATIILLLYLTNNPPLPHQPLLVPLLSLFSLTTVGPATILETIAILDTANTQTSYGSLRLYGALGWGVCSYLSGIVADYIDKNDRDTLASITYGFFIVCSVVSMGAVVGDHYWGRRGGETEESAAEPNEPLLDIDDIETPPQSVDEGEGEGETKTILAAPLILLTANLLITGICVSFVESFLFTYISSTYPTSTSSFLGFLIFVMTLFEVPIFVYSKQLIAYVGVQNIFTLSHVCYILRVVAYTYVPLNRIYFFAFLEPLHAFVFAAMMCAAVEAGRTLGGTEKAQGTIQALLRGVYYYIGLGVGSVIGGTLIDLESYHFMYRAGGVGLFVWAIAFRVIDCFVKR